MWTDWLLFFSELHMDLTKYYELKQPHTSRYLMDSLGGLGPTDVGGAKLDDFGAPPSSCCSPVLATGTSVVRRSTSPVASCLSSVPAEEHTGILMTRHIVDVAPPKAAVLGGREEHHLEELYMERWAKWKEKVVFHLWKRNPGQHVCSGSCVIKVPTDSTWWNLLKYWSLGVWTHCTDVIVTTGLVVFIILHLPEKEKLRPYVKREKRRQLSWRHFSAGNPGKRLFSWSSRLKMSVLVLKRDQLKMERSISSAVLSAAHFLQLLWASCRNQRLSSKRTPPAGRTWVYSITTPWCIMGNKSWCDEEWQWCPDLGTFWWERLSGKRESVAGSSVSWRLCHKDLLSCLALRWWEYTHTHTKKSSCYVCGPFWWLGFLHILVIRLFWFASE